MLTKTKPIHYKNGDKVEITFYSYSEPLCSCIGTVEGNYIEIESGSIPLRDFWTKEIRRVSE